MFRLNFVRFVNFGSNFDQLKKATYILVLLSICSFTYGQSNLDSLWGVWSNQNSADTTRMSALSDYAWDAFLYTQPDSTYHYATILHDFAKENNNQEFLAKAVKIMAVSHQVRGNYEEAEQFYEQSIEYTRQLGDRKALADIYFNMGSMYYVKSDFDSAISWYEKSLGIRYEIVDSVGMAGALNNIGGVYNARGEYQISIQYFEKSLAIKQALGDKAGTARTLTNIGIISYNHGDYATAVDYYLKGLKLAEEMGDKNGIATALINIGNLYNEQDESQKAIDYYDRASILMNEIGDKKGYSSALNNIGSIYRNRQQYDKALNYYERCAEINLSIDDQVLYSSTLNNIGLVHMKQANYDTALSYFEKSLEIKRKVGDKHGIVNSVNNIGGIHLKKGNPKMAIRFAEEALQLAREIGVLAQVEESASYLWEAYKATGNHKKALEMHELFVDARDSIASENNQKELIRQEYKYVYEKQAAADSVKAAEAAKVMDAQLAAEQAENKRHKIEAKQQAQQKYFLFGGLALALLFGAFIFNRFRVTNKQKKVIEDQKKKVDSAYDQLEEKNTEILDSINYAKRIQSAILPPKKLVTELLPKSFILYKPKDIVAGDFYWLEQKTGTILFAACDCTGHGVPGAMVSVVCNNGLNRSVREHGLTNPGEILDKTRDIVISEFEKSEEDVKDGMDIALCSIKGNVLKYAGAHNPLWIIRNCHAEPVEALDNSRVSSFQQAEDDTFCLYEIKADKQPIGKFDTPLPYTTHEIRLNQGDSVYIFSDGFADQFGGEKGKKFKASNFKKLLLSIQHESMDRQKTLLDEAFEDWRGDLEQLDDVCVIGVRT